jgi:membrane protein
MLGFPFAVIKKYGDDETAYEAALITYYGFLSLFPLLIVVTTLLRLLFSHGHLSAKLLAHISQYVPIIGSELQHSVHSLPKTGLGLAVAVIVTLYGARGVADAIRHAFNHIWEIPRSERPGFAGSTFHSLAIILLGGVGLGLAGFLSGEASGLGRSTIFRIFSSLVSLVVVLIVLWFVFQLATAKKIPRRPMIISVTIAAVGLQILQSLGGYLITHELRNLSTLYGAFALVLGLLFWIYLQAEVILYATQCGAVSGLGLWPRSVDSSRPTPSDNQAYELYKTREQLIKPD